MLLHTFDNRIVGRCRIIDETLDTFRMYSNSTWQRAYRQRILLQVSTYFSEY